MTYQEARAAVLKAESAHDAACATMSTIEARLASELAILPRGPMNLVAEPIRLHSEYVAAWKAERVAFERLRKVNAFMSRHFRKEIRAEIAERRKQRMARA